MGFRGYINSDTGIVHNMCRGVEAPDKAERIGFAVNQSGLDLISGLFDNELGREAYDRAVTRTLTEMFRLGMFENPCREAQRAVEIVSDRADWDEANEVHRKSVVPLKNDGTLPLTADKLSGKKVYAGAFHKNPDAAALREMPGDVGLTDVPAQADYAILMLNPSSGEYFSATPGCLELDICEGKTVCDADGVCVSPNDVPGFDKDRYMPDYLKDENGKAYAYRDAAGSYYELGFGLGC